jgi:hypothetical protein
MLSNYNALVRLCSFNEIDEKKIRSQRQILQSPKRTSTIMKYFEISYDNISTFEQLWLRLIDESCFLDQ